MKIVEIVIIQSSGEKMKQQVLKALANPARIFYVPYNLAVINFAVQFIVFIVVFTVLGAFCEPFIIPFATFLA